VRTIGTTRTLLVAALLALAACGGGESTTTDDAGGDVVQDVGEVADAAQEQLDDAGVSTDQPGTAVVTFMGETLDFTAVESFGCFIIEDGGSQGAVDFEGTSSDGAEVVIDWAGDSPDSASASLTTADGTEWTTPFIDPVVDVTVTGTSAEVSATLLSLADGVTTADLVARPSCG
jgi:ABC-type glycerol-3-phosphate transport system substrate-binding protein